MDNEILAGERQYPKAFNEAAMDHRERYHLALKYIKQGNTVLDAACGVGYGTYYLANNSNCESIIALDISDHALNWAHTYFESTKISYFKVNMEEEFVEKLPLRKFDVITCFETIEHMREDKTFLKRLKDLLKPDGTLLISAPNEDIIPHERNPFYENGKNPFHFRHYTSLEFEALMKECGLFIKEYYTQFLGELISGQGGMVNVLVCKNTPIETQVINDFEQIILTSSKLQVFQNGVLDTMHFTSLGKRFDEMLVMYNRLSLAYDLIESKKYDECLTILGELDYSICPERHFFEGLAHEGNGNYIAAIEKYTKTILIKNKLNPSLIHFAEQHLADLIQVISSGVSE